MRNLNMSICQERPLYSPKAKEWGVDTIIGCFSLLYDDKNLGFSIGGPAPFFSIWSKEGLEKKHSNVLFNYIRDNSKYKKIEHIPVMDEDIGR